MADQSPTFVLDSFALLAYIQGEKGAARVRELLLEGQEGGVKLFLCAINLAEVLYRTERQFGAEGARRVLAVIEYELPVEIVPADLSLSLDAAYLKAVCPVSLADCYIAALAQRSGATVVTGDQDFARPGPLVSVEWL